MESRSVQRRLAAILAADVVGYSRLMSADEVGTLEALKAHRRALVDRTIAGHRGRIVKTTGDGALVEFASVVDAVGCAAKDIEALPEAEANNEDHKPAPRYEQEIHFCTTADGVQLAHSRMGSG